MGSTGPEFIDDLRVLRRRRSLKWAQGAEDPERICLTIAEMDLDPPEFLAAALTEAVLDGATGYATTVEQERACERFLVEEHGASVAGLRSTTDVLAGLRAVLRAALPAGATVLVETPVYGDLMPTIAEAGCQARAVPLASQGMEYSHDWDALATAAAAGASAWVLCQPHNPVGRAWRADEIARAVALAREFDLLLIANEVHLPLGLDGALPSVFSEAGVHAVRALGLTSASKAFNIAGLKSASIYASERSAEFLAGLEQGYLGRPGILGAIGAVAAYEEGREWLDALRKRIRESVDTAIDGLAGLPVRLTVSPVEATYLLWARVAPEDRAVLARAMEQAHVRVSPGVSFGGAEFEGFFRLNAASHPAVLATAFDRIGEFIRSDVNSRT